MSPGKSVFLAADLLHRGLDAEAHRPHEEREARRLREQPHPAVVEDGREVEDLVDDRRHRRSHERPLDRLGRRVEAVADDLGRDRVGVGGVVLAGQPAAVDDRLGHRPSPVSVISITPLDAEAGRELRRRGRSSPSPRARSPGRRAPPASISARSSDAEGQPLAARERPGLVLAADAVSAERQSARAARRWSGVRIVARSETISHRLVHHVAERPVVVGGKDGANAPPSPPRDGRPPRRRPRR